MRPPPLRCSDSCAAAALVDGAPLYKAARLYIAAAALVPARTSPRPTAATPREPVCRGVLFPQRECIRSSAWNLSANQIRSLRAGHECPELADGLTTAVPPLWAGPLPAASTVFSEIGAERGLSMHRSREPGPQPLRTERTPAGPRRCRAVSDRCPRSVPRLTTSRSLVVRKSALALFRVFSPFFSDWGSGRRPSR